MQTSDVKYKAYTVPGDRRGHHTTPRPGKISWVIASMLVAVPLPAFAEADPSENIAFALSSKIVENHVGKNNAPGVVAGAIVDYSVAVADAGGFDENVTHIKLRPRGVLLTTIGKYERFSLRYRMKVK